MRRLLRRALAVGGLAAGLAWAGDVLAGESHADASSTTQASACKLALALARQDIAANRVRASRCECMEDKDEGQIPWSCTAFVSYR